jgi:hypothetical protein
MTLDYEQSTKRLVESYKAQYGSAIRIVYKSWGAAAPTLKDVKDDETLIIVGHGNVNQDGINKSERLGVTEGSPWGGANKERTIVTANGLADMLQARKLPKSHLWIKTMSCCGGGLARVENGAIGPTESPCFASVLARALYQRQYHEIVVGGYPGYVTVHEGVRRKDNTTKHTAKTITVRGQNTVGHFPHKKDPVNWPEYTTDEAHIIWHAGENGQPLV